MDSFPDRIHLTLSFCFVRNLVSLEPSTKFQVRTLFYQIIIVLSLFYFCSIVVVNEHGWPFNRLCKF